MTGGPERSAGERSAVRASGPRVGEGKRKVGRRWLGFWAGLGGRLGWFASSPILLFFFLSTQNYLNSNLDLNSKP